MPIFFDEEDEDTETMTLWLTIPSGAQFGREITTGTILDCSFGPEIESERPRQQGMLPVRRGCYVGAVTGLRYKRWPQVPAQRNSVIGRRVLIDAIQ